jgi:hypothetical protein
MSSTIAELINMLNLIEDKNQPYIGTVYIAEDFTYETDEGEEKFFTPEQLAKVAEYRSVDKSLGWFYDEVYNHLHDLLTEEENN